MPSTIPVSSNVLKTTSYAPFAIIDGAASFGYFACASIGRIKPTGRPRPAARSISCAV